MSQRYDFRYDLKHYPTNHNERMTLDVTVFYAQKGGLAFLLTVNKLVCGFDRLEYVGVSHYWIDSHRRFGLFDSEPPTSLDGE